MHLYAMAYCHPAGESGRQKAELTESGDELCRDYVGIPS